MMKELLAWGKKNPWIKFFVFIQIVLIFWGGFLDGFFNVQVPAGGSAVINSESQVVPGWDDSPRLRFILGPWMRWDTGFYLKIAMDNYALNAPRNAFAPLYPLVIAGLGRLLGGHFLLAGLLISQASLFVFCAMLYGYTSERWDEQSAERAVQYLLFFPTAYYLFAGYSESLSLVFILLAFQQAVKGEWKKVGIWGALSTMTRFISVSLVIPYVYLWWRSKERKLKDLLYIGLIPASVALWGIYLHTMYGSYPWARLSGFAGVRNGWPWEGIWNNARLVFSKGTLGYAYLHLDLLAVVLLIIWVWAASRKLGVEYGLFVLACFIVPLFQVGSAEGILVSISRFALIAFPGFMVMAVWGTDKRFHLAWTVFSLVLLLFYAGQFFLWGWVG